KTPCSCTIANVSSSGCAPRPRYLFWDGRCDPGDRRRPGLWRSSPMVAFAMSRVGRGLQIGERLLGRRRLWRLGRLIYAYSRRDLPEALAVDAEHGVLRRLA